MDERDDEKTKETKKSIEEAQEAYKKILENKHDMELAELREKYVRDQISIKKTGYRQGRESGIEEGKALGRAEGRAYNVPIDVDTIEKGYPKLCA